MKVAIKLFVLSVKPGNMIVTPQKSNFVLVNDIINCSAVGSATLNYTWSVITAATNTSVAGSTLTVKKSYAGPVLFQCLVQNIYGNANSTINTTVVGEFNQQR
jgi:hypothetical protein